MFLVLTLSLISSPWELTETPASVDLEVGNDDTLLDVGGEPAWAASFSSCSFFFIQRS